MCKERLSELEHEECEYSVGVIIIVSIILILAVMYDLFGFIRLFRVFHLPEPHDIVCLRAYELDLIAQKPQCICESSNVELEPEGVLKVFCV